MSSQPWPEPGHYTRHKRKHDAETPERIAAVSSQLEGYADRNQRDGAREVDGHEPVPTHRHVAWTVGPVTW